MPAASQFAATGATVKLVIMLAYDLQESQIIGGEREKGVRRYIPAEYSFLHHPRRITATNKIPPFCTLNASGRFYLKRQKGEAENVPRRDAEERRVGFKLTSGWGKAAVRSSRFSTEKWLFT